MPKFYGQNKKRVDPRYFMDEKLEEATDWPEDKTQDAMMGRASGLAQQGMEQASTGVTPPWEAPDEEGDGFTDAALSEADFDLLENIHRHLSIAAGGGDRAERFAEVMSKLGIALGGSEGSSAEEEESEEDRYHRERHEDHKSRWR